MKKTTARKHLSREELLSKFQTRPEQMIEVPMLGLVRVRVPSFPRLIELRSACQSEEDYKLGMILASCPDLKAEDLEAMKAGNGFIIAALVSAVTQSDTPITDDSVGKQSTD